MAKTPLHALRSRLEALAALAEENFWAVYNLSAQTSEVEALALLFSAADTQLTGASIPLHQYFPRVRQILQGEVWAWHLADGGYSRIVVSLIDGNEVMTMDFGLSRPRAKSRWIECNGGRSASRVE